MIELTPLIHPVNCSINLGGSKSICNRLLILNALMGTRCKIENLSDSDDTVILQRALDISKQTDSATINVAHAGTAMRFLSAYLSQKPGHWFLTGSVRMKERPIAPLVDALRAAGAEIEYVERQGYPPLSIKGKKLRGGSIRIDGSMSSQFVSALLLASPSFTEGVALHLENKIVSEPYIEMTIGLLRDFGITVSSAEHVIRIAPGQSPKPPENYCVESDWSSASYWFSVCAMGPGNRIILPNLRANSLQADSVLPQIYKNLGLNCEFKETGILIQQTSTAVKELEYNFINCPDIAQTVAISCFALGVKARLEGIETLKIKETNRIEALAVELNKLGADVHYSDTHLEMNRTIHRKDGRHVINTYGDHRMAMSFAPLSYYAPNLCLANESVVSKSYPRFWDDLKSAGFNVHLLP